MDLRASSHAPRWLAVAFSLMLTACDAPAPEVDAAAAPPPAVTVVRVQLEDFTTTSTFTGRVEAAEKVELRARVQGFLEQRAFEEGAMVARDDLLFVIEKAPYETAVAQARGALASAEAGLRLADVEAARFQELAKKQAVAQSELDLRVARQAEAAGALQQSQAALQKAELDLSYTDIRAPMAGRVGRAAYSVGNLVGPASEALAVIVSQDPMNVSFPVSQRALLRVRERDRTPGANAAAVRIKLRLADGTLYPHTGTPDFVDVQVNPSTDTVSVRAALPNPEQILIDGALVTVIVESAETEPSLLIPQQALQADQSGLYVLVVDEESKVRVRRVQTGPAVDGRVPVRSGLAAGERVIIEGGQKVRPDITVTATETKPRAPGAGS